MTDPSPHRSRRGMAVRSPSRAHRVLTYPRPPRPGRRVSTVCAPCRPRRTTPGPPPGTQRRRAMIDPTPHRSRRGMAVRSPSRAHRVLTYPRPARPGRRVTTVRVPQKRRRAMTDPLAALPAARHGRPVAIPRAPGADVPSATTAGAPGQHRLRAAKKAPGHGRPLAAPPAARHDRPVAIPKAPGRDVPPASTAGAPGHDRPRAVAIATAPLAGRPTPAAPAGLAPHPCQSPHPDLLAFPPHRLVIAAQAAIQPPITVSRACKHSPPLQMLERGPGGEAHPHQPPSASCQPSPAPTAVVLHRAHGPLCTTPRPRPPAAPSLRRKHAPYPDTGPQSPPSLSLCDGEGARG